MTPRVILVAHREESFRSVVRSSGDLCGKLEVGLRAVGPWAKAVVVDGRSHTGKPADFVAVTMLAKRLNEELSIANQLRLLRWLRAVVVNCSLLGLAYCTLDGRRWADRTLDDACRSSKKRFLLVGEDLRTRGRKRPAVAALPERLGHRILIPGAFSRDLPVDLSPTQLSRVKVRVALQKVVGKGRNEGGNTIGLERGACFLVGVEDRGPGARWIKQVGRWLLGGVEDVTIPGLLVRASGAEGLRAIFASEVARVDAWIGGLTTASLLVLDLGEDHVATSMDEVTNVVSGVLSERFEGTGYVYDIGRVIEPNAEFDGSILFLAVRARRDPGMGSAAQRLGLREDS